MDLLVSSISSSLAYGIGRMSAVNSRAFFPSLTRSGYSAGLLLIKLKIDATVDVQPIHLLKMTCPSTAHIHALRVPPTLTSARAAIRWVNWDIDSEAFALET